MNSTRLRSLAAAAVLSVLSGCNVVPPAQDDPTRHFVLSDPAAQAAPAPAPGAARIGLRTVKLEGYLARKSMVVRTGQNEVEFEDYMRWAEPLEGAIARIVRLRLLGSPGVASVAMEPFPLDPPRDYDVSIDVRRCEGSKGPSGRYSASFSATIVISTAGANPSVVATRLFTAPAAEWDGRDFGALASLLSADVSALGQDVAAGIPPRG
jgi:uncharacterized lipoprotein YmbA